MLRNKAALEIQHVLKDLSIHAISDIPLKHGQLIRQNASLVQAYHNLEK